MITRKPARPKGVLHFMQQFIQKLFSSSSNTTQQRPFPSPTFATPQPFPQQQLQARWLSQPKLSSSQNSKHLSEQSPYTSTNQCIPNYQGQMREVTVLFCDIRGYTTLVEKYPPNIVVQQLNEYFSAMTRVIFQHNGCLDKYLGDGLLAYFEPTDGTLASSARNAAQAALAMEEALNELNERWKHHGLPELNIGIGLNSGIVFIGNIGSQMKMDFTIIGDNVNLAARLEPMNKLFQTRHVISHSTYRLIRDQFQTRYLGEMPIKGKENTMRIYELQTRQIQREPQSLHTA